MVADQGLWPPPEHLGQHTVVGVSRRDPSVEGLGAFEQRRPLGFGSLVHPGAVVEYADIHQQRSFGSDRGFEGIDDPVSSSLYRADGSQ
jgi:hypothetical protein